MKSQDYPDLLRKPNDLAMSSFDSDNVVASEGLMIYSEFLEVRALQLILHAPRKMSMTKRLVPLLLLSGLLLGQSSQAPKDKGGNLENHPNDQKLFGDRNNAKVVLNNPPGAIQFNAPKTTHHIKLQPGTAPGEASFDYSYPYATLFGCVNNRMPERPFGAQTTVIVFATASCHFGDFLKIRGQPNGNGWDFEIDAKNDGSYSMKVRFDF